MDNIASIIWNRTRWRFRRSCAAQILSEMLGMVCHSEYFLNPPRSQTVNMSSYTGPILTVGHSNSFRRLFRIRIFCNFSFRISRDDPSLHHTRRYNLLSRDDRTEFIRHFVALLRFIAAGEANIGHLRNDSDTIHRSADETTPILHPPQEAMDESEEGKWRSLSAFQYAD